jgi:hypothetical protein
LAASEMAAGQTGRWAGWLQRKRGPYRERPCPSSSAGLPRPAAARSHPPVLLVVRRSSSPTCSLSAAAAGWAEPTGFMAVAVVVPAARGWAGAPAIGPAWRWSGCPAAAGTVTPAPPAGTLGEAVFRFFSMLVGALGGSGERKGGEEGPWVRAENAS